MSTIIILLSISLISAYPGQVKLNTPDGSLNLILKDDAQNLVEQGQLSSSILIGNIVDRLNSLESVYTDKLRKSERFAIEALLTEIQFLINLFPKNYHVIILPYIPTPSYFYLMSKNDFNILLHWLKNEPFSDDQLNMLCTAAKSNFFTIEQLERILDVFAFEIDRIEAVKIFYPKILDKENSFRLYSKFDFSKSKDELEALLQ